VKRLPVLPSMRCDTGCGECCGPVPVTAAELGAVRDFMKKHDVVPRDNGPLTCPFLQEGRCAIYGARPLICRIFGHSRDLQCSRGYNVNVPERVLEKAIRDNGRVVALLHSLLPSEPACPDTSGPCGH
jgi:uncharacterized protein